MSVAERAKAFATAISALAAVGELVHVAMLARELVALVADGAATHRETPSSAERRAKNADVPMEALTLTNPVVTPVHATKAKPGRERTAAWRRNKRAREAAARAGDPRQLAIDVVTRVTERHAATVTTVTSDVTVTPSLSASSLSSSEPCKGSKEERERVSLRSRDAVTVTVPEQLDAGLHAVFVAELAKRPGVTFEAAWLWAKFRGFGYVVRSREHLELLWARWCTNERPMKAAPIAATVPLSPPAIEVAKEEVAATDRPGPRSAPVDLEEHSRRIAVEQIERVARERAEYEKVLPSLRDGAASVLAALGVPTRRAS